MLDYDYFEVTPKQLLAVSRASGGLLHGASNAVVGDYYVITKGLHYVLAHYCIDFDDAIIYAEVCKDLGRDAEVWHVVCDDVIDDALYLVCAARADKKYAACNAVFDNYNDAESFAACIYDYMVDRKPYYDVVRVAIDANGYWSTLRSWRRGRTVRRG